MPSIEGIQKLKSEAQMLILRGVKNSNAPVFLSLEFDSEAALSYQHFLLETDNESIFFRFNFQMCCVRHDHLYINWVRDESGSVFLIVFWTQCTWHFFSGHWDQISISILRLDYIINQQRLFHLHNLYFMHYFLLSDNVYAPGDVLTQSAIIKLFQVWPIEHLITFTNN